MLCYCCFSSCAHHLLMLTLCEFALYFSQGWSTYVHEDWKRFLLRCLGVVWFPAHSGPTSHQSQCDFITDLPSHTIRPSYSRTTFESCSFHHQINSASLGGKADCSAVYFIARLSPSQLNLLLSRTPSFTVAEF